MLDATSSRNLLCAAIADREVAKEREIAGARAVARAKQIAENTEQQLALYGDLDQRVADHKAEIIKQSVAGSSPSGDLPQYLADFVERRDALKRDLPLARAACDRLASEQQKLASASLSAEAAVRAAAEAVIVNEAAPLVDELHAASERVRMLSDRLRSLEKISGLPPGAAEVLKEAPAASYFGKVRESYSDECDRWSQYLEALMQDSGATRSLS